MKIEFLKRFSPTSSLSLSHTHTHTLFTHVKMHRPPHSEEPLCLLESNAAARASQVALEVKNPPANAGDISDAGSIPGSGRSPGGGNGNPLQNSCLEYPMDKWAWWAAVHGVAKNQTQLKKAMAPHSSTLAWKIPWMEEPGRLQSMGSQRVKHDWATSLSLFTLMHWRRKWHPTPVFLPGESQGWGSLVGCHLWGRTKSDTTKAT